MPDLTYLYCVVKTSRKPSLGRAPDGVPGAGQPRAVRGPRGAWLILADVPAEAYDAEAINANLKDLDWVSVRAMAHEAVVEHFARRADVVPMKLFTIFRSDARAVADLAANADLPAIFRKIGGCVEWGVRVSRAPGIESAPRMPHVPTPSREVSGAGFLLEKKQQRDESRAAAVRSRRAADEAFRALSRIARDSLRKDADVPGTVLLLEAAFLVPRARQRTFTASAKKQARLASDAGCDLSLTGPWPAYHFVGR